MYFGQSWTFSNTNMQKMYSRMSEEDHEEFPCTAKAEDRDQHYTNAVNGLRKYFLKESDDDIVIARRKLRNFKILRFTFYALTFSLAAYFFYLLKIL